MYSKCSECGKKFWFKKIVICGPCQKKIEDRKEEERLKRMEETHQRKLERRKLARKKADDKLKTELLVEEKKHKKKSITVVKEKKIVNEEEAKVFKKRKEVFDDYKNYDSYLLIEVSMKQITATEWIKGKKRVVINRIRELRRTHAGGYSAEKFQKHVDIMKSMTFDWMIGHLEKPGVLKKEYEFVSVVSKNEELKKQIEEWLEKSGYLN